MTEIKERPILFSSEMVRAILDDRKTETRRVLKPKPKRYKEIILDTLKSFSQGKVPSYYVLSKAGLMCPYGKPGDILYVREMFMFADEADGGIYYKADVALYEDYNFHSEYKWKPSIHMLKKHSRIKLKIKEIRVERLQSITESDAIKEGIKPLPTIMSARRQFAILWDSLNKKRGFGWDKNVWVWVIKFERMK